MLAPVLQSLTIRLSETETVSALLCLPQNARACYVFAHGAGAGMNHSFLISVSSGLAERGIATLRYQFPFMERGSKRPDPPAVAHATVRAAVAHACSLLPGLPLFAGGKSFGGRMTSQAHAEAALPQIRGLIFLGFPLHPAKKPSQQRAAHLAQVGCQMLFLQGTRDELAAVDLIRSVTAELGERATLHLFADADHSFHVPARSGQTDQQVQDSLCDAIRDWTATR
jgi:predicted alpha/beta-hydrolase family hydrolase